MAKSFGDETVVEILDTETATDTDYEYTITHYQETDYGEDLTWDYYEVESVKVRDKTKSSYGEPASHLVKIDGTWHMYYSGERTDDGELAQVNDLTETYKDCTNLTSMPVLPDYIATLNRTYSGCTSLTTTRSIPVDQISSMYRCFKGCTSLVTPPTFYYKDQTTTRSVTVHKSAGGTETKTLPWHYSTGTIIGMTFIFSYPVYSILTNFEECFYGCTSLTSMPTLVDTQSYRIHQDPNAASSTQYDPYEVWEDDHPYINLTSCFYNCSSLSTTTTLIERVRRVDNCFYGAFSQDVNIHVACEITGTTNVVDSTSGRHQVYILNDAKTSATEASWREAASYSPYLHYELDDVTNPAMGITVKRVDANNSTTEDDEGAWAWISGSQSYGIYIPVGYSNTVNITLTRNSSAESVTWGSATTSNGTATKTFQKWISLGSDTGRQVFRYQLTQTVKDGNNSTVLSRSTQDTELILPAIFAMVDFKAGGLGMGIGTYAKADNLLNIAFETEFSGDVTTKADLIVEDDMYIDLDNINDADLIQNVNQLGWTTEQNQLFDAIYPVGTCYETYDTNIDPNTAFYGVWSNDDYKETKKLLWTNNSPTSRFAATTINVSNINQYDFIDVMFAHYIDAMNVAIFRCEVGGYTGVASVAGVANTGDCRRTFYTNSSGVVFSVGYVAPGNTTTISSGASNAAYNDAAIPIKIYGVKKVKVWKRTD